jgi:hypothetical protein
LLARENTVKYEEPAEDTAVFMMLDEMYKGGGRQIIEVCVEKCFKVLGFYRSIIK